MKNKITILLTLFFSFCFVNNVFASSWSQTDIYKEMKCNFDWTDRDTISWCLSKYKSDKLVWAASTWATDDNWNGEVTENINNEYTLEKWFKKQVDTLLWNVWLLLWIIYFRLCFHKIIFIIRCYNYLIY